MVQKHEHYNEGKKKDWKFPKYGRNVIILIMVNAEGHILNPIKSRTRNWLEHCVIKDVLGIIVDGKNVKGRNRYHLIDNIKINGSYVETKLLAKMQRD